MKIKNLFIPIAALICMACCLGGIIYFAVVSGAWFAYVIMAVVAACVIAISVLLILIIRDKKREDAQNKLPSYRRKDR